jgi:indolepyruvate ferredoxin oxidoreductase
VVSAGAKTLGLMRTGRTGAVVNSHEIVTGDFTRDTEFRMPVDRTGAVAAGADQGPGSALFDASELARAIDGRFDLLQHDGLRRGLADGASPAFSHDAIRAAIELNGAAVERNKRAFEIGPLGGLNPDEAALPPDVDAEVVAKPKSLEEKIAFRAAHLTKPTRARGWPNATASWWTGSPTPRLKEAVAKGYHKLLAYKDEYEVARLHLETARRHAKAVRRRFPHEIPPRPAAAERTAPRAAGQEAGIRAVDRCASTAARADEAAARHALDPFGYGPPNGAWNAR